MQAWPLQCVLERASFSSLTKAMSTLPRRLALLRFSRKPPLPILRVRAVLWIAFTSLSVNGWTLLIGSV